ncbi:MAG: hypothetical protein WA021_02000 [Minisyncoccia bacterium]
MATFSKLVSETAAEFLNTGNGDGGACFWRDPAAGEDPPDSQACESGLPGRSMRRWHRRFLKILPPQAD